VIRISIPPLRERVEDIPLLVEHYLRHYWHVHRLPAADVAPEAMDALMAYRWPGNIRELRNVVERVVLKAAGRPIAFSHLPPEIVRTGVLGSQPLGAALAPQKPSLAEELATQMFRNGESFWSAVYPVFMSRDMTRSELRKIVEAGLEQTNGNYRLMVQLFNMPNADYKRFLSFLRKHDCHLPFQRFRAAPARVVGRPPLRAVAGGKN
jgi:DNA-binding NtrC family response regulator